METKYNKETVRDSLPTLKGRVSLSPELIKTREGTLLFAFAREGTLLFAFETKNNTIKKTLEEAVRRKANLRWADLRWADLQWADLRWADLQGANLRGADLRGADLRWAKMDKKG